jgi:hypothetical protein
MAVPRAKWLALAALLTAHLAAQESPNVASAPPIVRPTYESDRGPSIAFDEAHKNTHTIGGQFQAFARLLRRDGYRVRALTDAVSRQALDGIDILVLAQPGGWEGPDASLTAAEVGALLEWVRAGGSLLLIVDHMPGPAGAQRLATALGVEQWHNGYAGMETPRGPVFNLRFTRSGELPEAAVVPLLGTNVAWQGPGAAVLEHSITSGRDANERVDSVLSFGGSAFQLPVGAVPLLVLPPGAMSFVPVAGTAPTAEGTPRVSVAGWHQAAVLSLGRGRVGLFAELGIFSAQWPVHPAASRNYQLALNVMRWLGEPAR